MEMKGRGGGRNKRNIGGTQSDRESMLRKKKEVSHSKGELQTDRMHGCGLQYVCTLVRYFNKN